MRVVQKVTIDDAFIERLQRVMRDRKLKMRSWSLEAGLSPTHVEQFVNKRLSRTKVSTVRQLAEAANVRLRWLATGEGARAPFDKDERLDEPASRAPACASLEQFRTLMRAEDGADPVLLDALGHAVPQGLDPGLGFWRREYQILREEQLAIREMMATPRLTAAPVTEDQASKAAGGGSSTPPSTPPVTRQRRTKKSE